jgi:hypothetical protein
VKSHEPPGIVRLAGPPLSGPDWATRPTPRRPRRDRCAGRQRWTGADPGEPCAYSYGRGLFYRGDLIGPVARADAATGAQALRAELAASAGREIRVDIPGSATMLVEVTPAAGIRLTDPGLLLLSPACSPCPGRPAATHRVRDPQLLAALTHAAGSARVVRTEATLSWPAKLMPHAASTRRGGRRRALRCHA